MKILVVNAGSSSLKYQLLDMETEKLLAKGLVEKIGIAGSKLTHKVNGKSYEYVEKLENHEQGLSLVLKVLQDKKVGVISSLKEISAVGHRVLHGGEKYKKPVLLDEKVLKNLKELIPLGPLHMPANILGIEACIQVMPGVPNVALFDTSFHTTMPQKAFLYATPYEWYEKYAVRRYGFHGISHEYIARTVENLEHRKNLRIINCHIGNGASLAAIKNGKCVDTSMGLTPLEGLVMGTRSGDLDPAVLEYVMNKEGMDIKEMLQILNKKSGLLGISGVSSDIRDVQAAVKDGNKRAKLAIECFIYRIKKYIGSYAAALGGVDVIVFTAGTGENRDEIREEIMSNMEFMGVDFDVDANKNFKRGEICLISKPTSKVKVYVIPTDEELMIARETKSIVEGTGVKKCSKCCRKSK